MSVEIEVRVTKSTDGWTGVLIQLPAGWAVLRPEDARHLASVITLTAEEAEKQ